jgi:hypothetical protein
MPPPSPGPRPADLPAGLAWPVRVDPLGRAGPTRVEARSRRWRRCSQGLYVPARAEQNVEQRIVEAAALLPVYGGVTGWAALRWLGGVWFNGTAGGRSLDRPVALVLMDSSIRARPGIAISEERVGPEQLMSHAGITVTTGAYALLWEVRHVRSLSEAVQAADMAAFSDLVSRAELALLVAASRGWTGIARGRAVVEMMEENSWSPAETSMRGIWTEEAGLPRPMCNQPVFDLGGRLIGTPDLIDPVLGVVGEYDSELHLESSRRRRDLEREALFRAAGLEPVAMVTGELGDPWPFVARLRAAYGRAARKPASQRRWTIDPPCWWTPTVTVQQRRALTDDQRARWLRHRQPDPRARGEAI